MYSNPKETVKTIVNILDSLKIQHEVLDTSFFKPQYYSCRIHLKGNVKIGTNGKGDNYDYALASGYAEFMERIQNFSLYKLPSFARTPFTYYYDEIFHSDNFQFFSKKYSIYTDKIKEKQIYVNYYNYFNNVPQLLPISYLLDVAGSTGMCAGNSYEECMISGICEIFERYVSTKILVEKIMINSYSIYDNLISNSTRTKIFNIENGSNYKITIKNCTLNLFPVVGVLLEDKSSNHFIFKLASHPNLDIAINRCLNEMFQGNDLHNNSLFVNKLDIKIDLLQIKNLLKNGKCNYTSIFGTDFSKTSDFSWIQRRSDNRQYFNYLTSLLKKNKYDLYIRNNSYLGFPAYHVFIPELSELFNFNSLLENELYEEINNLNEIKAKINTAINRREFIILEGEYNVYEINGIYVDDTILSIETVDFYNFKLSIYKNNLTLSLLYLKSFLNYLKKNKYDKLYRYFSSFWDVICEVNSGIDNKIISHQIEDIKRGKYLHDCLLLEKCGDDCNQKSYCITKKLLDVNRILVKKNIDYIKEKVCEKGYHYEL